MKLQPGQPVTITAGSAKERYQRVRELLKRGYMIEKLYDHERTVKQFKDTRYNGGPSAVFAGDTRIRTFVAVMRRVQS